MPLEVQHGIIIRFKNKVVLFSIPDFEELIAKGQQILQELDLSKKGLTESP